MLESTIISQGSRPSARERPTTRRTTNDARRTTDDARRGTDVDVSCFGSSVSFCLSFCIPFMLWPGGDGARVWLGAQTAGASAGTHGHGATPVSAKL